MSARPDAEAITGTLHRLAAATDARDWATIRATFTTDGSGYGRTGADAIVAVMREHLGGCGPTQHLLGNHRITVDGDRARSLTYVRVYHQGAGPCEGLFYECMGEYDDRLVREGDRWRLTSREFDMRITLGDFAVLRP
ncbi:MAG: nuclear transport factor 2 family protein [Sciscionella sp.]